MSGWPIDVSNATSGSIIFDTVHQNQRSALSLVGNTLYVAYGGHIGDCGDYHGWVMGIDTQDPTMRGGWATAGRVKGSGLGRHGLRRQRRLRADREQHPQDDHPLRQRGGGADHQARNAGRFVLSVQLAHHGQRGRRPRRQQPGLRDAGRVDAVEDPGCRLQGRPHVPAGRDRARRAGRAQGRLHGGERHDGHPHRGRCLHHRERSSTSPSEPTVGPCVPGAAARTSCRC